MSKIRLLAIALLASTFGACKIDPLPTRPNRDGATEAGRNAGMDSGLGLDAGDAAAFRLDANGSMSPESGADTRVNREIGTDAVTDKGGMDAFAAAGDAGGEDAAIGTDGSAGGDALSAIGGDGGGDVPLGTGGAIGTDASTASADARTPTGDAPGTDSPPDVPVGGSGGTGGTATTGGGVATGGGLGTGGSAGTSAAGGGTTSSGGVGIGGAATGGTISAGGTTSAGGTSTTGGIATTGGSTGFGGTSTAGGTAASGGISSAGGTTTATGGTAGAGGASAAGGTTASGGTDGGVDAGGVDGGDAGPIQPGIWITAAQFDTPREAHTSVAYNGYVYVLGGTTDGGVTGLNDVQYAPFNPDGSLGTWQSTTSFNTGRDRHASVAYNGHLYVIGGAPSGGGVLNDVQHAPIHPDGSLGTWQSTTSFNTGRLCHASVVSNGYLYVIQGFYASAAAPLSDVQFAKINADGSVGTWQSTTTFSPARFNHRSIAYNGRIYSVGGTNWSGSYYSLGDVQYASVNADGTLATWQSATPLIQPRSWFSLVEHNGFLLITGGANDAAGVYMTSVEYVNANTDGSLGTWREGTPLNVARAFHGSVVNNGYLYVLGGANVTGILGNDAQYENIGPLP